MADNSDRPVAGGVVERLRTIERAVASPPLKVSVTNLDFGGVGAVPERIAKYGVPIVDNTYVDSATGGGIEVFGSATTSLASMGAGVYVASTTVLDNSVAALKEADFQLTLTLASAPVSAVYFDLYAVYSFDGGTNYDTLGASSKPSGSNYLGSFEPVFLSTIQRCSLLGVNLKPCFMKFVLLNGTGINLSAATTHKVTYRRR